MPTDNPGVGVTGANTIYLIFTSGSTGRPKCSGVTHASFANLVHWYRCHFNLGENDRFLLNSSLSFDLTQKISTHRSSPVAAWCYNRMPSMTRKPSGSPFSAAR